MDERFPFRTPLNSELMKKSQETFAQLVLKHCDPERYADLLTIDKPDLQMPDYSVGIEVTEAISEDEAQIQGEFVKMRFGKESPEAKEKCREIIEKRGGKVDTYPIPGLSDIIHALSYPSTDFEKEKAVYQNAIKKKMKKIQSYREKGFQRVGLFMLCEGLPIPPVKISDWLDCFEEAQEGYTEQYDFLYFCYPCALLFYDFKSREYHVFRIDAHEYDDMKIRARVGVEGIRESKRW